MENGSRAGTSAPGSPFERQIHTGLLGKIDTMERQTESGRLPTIGIIGGGQLGKMMTQAAKRMGFTVGILDPTPGSPAGQLADWEIQGTFDDEEAIRQLISSCDVTTYDIEHIAVDAIAPLWSAGHHIYPSPRVLGIVQDKLAQKQLFEKHGIPVPKYRHVGEPDRDAFRSFGYPLVQKARHGGYDGKGVKILEQESDFHEAIPADSFLEPKLAIDKELAVMVARGRDGEIRTYPVVEMVFDSRANLLDLLLSPARISDTIAKQATALAVRTVEAVQSVGMYGVEMFLTTDGELLINEVAPRPHNSGHYTIEACVTHQFEQHLRAVLGLPLGDTDQLRPAAMVNLLGAPGHTGRPVIKGLEKALSLPGATIHIYGKTETRQFRKMGHATVLAEDLEIAMRTALEVRERISIESEDVR